VIKQPSDRPRRSSPPQGRPGRGLRRTADLAHALPAGLSVPLPLVLQVLGRKRIRQRWNTPDIVWRVLGRTGLAGLGELGPRICRNEGTWSPLSKHRSKLWSIEIKSQEVFSWIP